jgi:hypothetical protein
MDLNPIVNLGIGGFAILVMWWMYQSAAKERTEHFQSFRALEQEVRETVMGQLSQNTIAMAESAKVMERVLERLAR